MTANTQSGMAFEPNITPMLDVLLVLIITFLAALPTARRAMDVQLPQPCVGVCGSGDQIVLEVLPGPAYRINQRPVQLAELAARLKQIYAPRNDKTIQIAGRPGVSYDVIMNAIDVAKSAGVRVVGIAPKDVR